MLYKLLLAAVEPLPRALLDTACCPKAAPWPIKPKASVSTISDFHMVWPLLSRHGVDDKAAPLDDAIIRAALVIFDSKGLRAVSGRQVHGVHDGRYDAVAGGAIGLLVFVGFGTVDKELDPDPPTERLRLSQRSYDDIAGDRSAERHRVIRIARLLFKKDTVFALAVDG